MGATTRTLFALAVTIVLTNAQPVEELPILKDMPSEVLFRSGKSLVLECGTVGDSGKQIQYSWKKDGKPLDSKLKEGTLTIEKPQQENEGIYQCFAQTDAGIATSRPISVKRAYLNSEPAGPHKIQPTEGGVLKLNSPTADAYPKPSITWMRKNYGGDFETVLDARVIHAPDNSLYFTNVTQGDINTYRAVASSPAVDEPVLLIEYVIDQVRPRTEDGNGELKKLYISKDVVGIAGQVTMLYCIYGGTPLAHPDWYFGSKNVNGEPSDRVTRYNRSKGKRLLIKQTLASDAGTYTCKADNEVGKPQQSDLNLTVVSVPTLAKKPETKQIAREGQDLTIPCQVTGAPAPKISWTYNGAPLALSDRLSVANARANDLSVGDLIIKKLQKSDKGYYSCHAINEYGDVFVQSLIYVA